MGNHGSLVIIGGAEDHDGNKTILRKFIALAGAGEQPLAVVTAASTAPDDAWERYRSAFAALGAHQLIHVRTASRTEAGDEAVARRVAQAHGIFMTGGDQKRLMAVLGGTLLAQAMRQAHGAGACIAGTSAGASGMCTHMLAEGEAELAPEKGAVRLGAGLDFLRRVIVDQHFSQRHRMSRLLGVIAQNPSLLGVGIDEDTALIICRGGVEVVGEGCVTVLDCRRALSNLADTDAGAVPQILGVRLHLLPPGSAFTSPTGSAAAADLLHYLGAA